MTPITLYADFHNADAQGRLRLNCRGTLEDLERNRLQFREGQQFRFSDGELQAEGKVTFADKENIWVAVIDWTKIANDTDGSLNRSNSATIAESSSTVGNGAMPIDSKK